MKKLILALAATVLVAGLTVTPALADILPFSGSGTSGTTTGVPGMPFSYDYDAGTAGAVPDWGIPGVGAGTIPWDGPIAVSDFEITFDLPLGIYIDPAQITVGNGAHCGGSTGGGTTFCAGPYSAPWDAVLTSTDSMTFYASPGNVLTPGDSFFVNIMFAGGDPSGASFHGEWSTPTPEPGTLVLLGSGLLGLAGAAKRRLLG